MRVHTTLGPLILSAGLCAARACAPHPRSTTTSSWTSETASSTAIGSTATEVAATTSGLTSEEARTVTESDTAVESSVTILTSATETSTVETSAFETTTAEALISTIQASTSATEAPTRTTEDSTTTTTSPAQSVQSPPNGDFEDATLDPWVSTGTTAVLARGNFCYEKNQCARLPGPYSGNTAKICQSVAIQQGYEYTFSAYLRQSCTYDAGESEPIDCSNNANTVQLTIDGAAYASKSVSWDNQWHEYSTTFRYIGPSIDSTDLCVAAVIAQGDTYEYYVDAVSLVRGKSVPVPEES